MDLDLKVSGGVELEKALLQLPIEIAVNELSKAMRAGAEVVATAVEQEAPRSQDIGPRRQKDQHIADSIVVNEERSPIGSAVEFYVGPSKSVAWRAKFNELGTTNHVIIAKRKRLLASPDQIFGTKVEHPGEQPKPFMRIALTDSAEDAIKKIAEKLAAGVKRAAARISRQWAPARRPKDFSG